MSTEQFNALMIQRLDDIVMELRAQRAENQEKFTAVRTEMKEEHQSLKTDVANIKTQLTNLSERVMKLEYKLNTQQWILCSASAAVGAVIWKLPQMITWIKDLI